MYRPTTSYTTQHTYVASTHQPEQLRYSPLEHVVEEAIPLVISTEKARVDGYITPQQHDYFVVDAFLTNSQPTVFVGDAADVKEHIHSAFEKTTGMHLPSNIIITICDENTLRETHERRSGRWSQGIVGFSFNGHGQRPSEVFVLQGTLDHVMLTMGHEIGHVISPTLPDARDEEAKAFSFSMAWMRTIVDNNIAGLANCINPRPAENGLHDVAFHFVLSQMREGLQPLTLFHQLREKTTSIRNTLEHII